MDAAMPEGVSTSSTVVLAVLLVAVSTFVLWKRPPRKKKLQSTDTTATGEASTSMFDVFGGERNVGEGVSFLEALFGEGAVVEPPDKEETNESDGATKINTDSLELSETNEPSFFDIFVNFASAESENEDDNGTLDKLIIGARKFASGSANSDRNMKTSESTESIDRFLAELKFVGEALKKNFSHLNVQDLHPLSVLYYLEKEDSVKTPSWKRRNHRFLPDIDKETVYGMHDAPLFERAELSRFQGRD